MVTIINTKLSLTRQAGRDLKTGQTHLNPYTEKTLHDSVYLFPTD